MAEVRPRRYSFNRGLISALGAARMDLERHAMAADISVNWMPRKLGPMMLRPGWGYLGATAGNKKSRNLRFIRSATTQAKIEVTEDGLRVWIDDELVTRPTVTAAVTNGTFDTDLTGWTDADESGAASTWLAGGYLSLDGTGTLAAIRTQEVTVNQVGTEHALRIEVTRGPVLLRIGSSAGGDEYQNETELGTGTHSIAFTPSGNFHIQLLNRRNFVSLITSITVEAAGVMVLPVPYLEADLGGIRYRQSADVMYVGCTGYQQRKIERRASHSWSIVLYEPEDGPFRLLNTGPVTISASAVQGDITLTASAALFRSTHVGALFRMTSSGQLETAALSASDTYTDPIRVIGVGGQRAISILITGTWVGTLTLQYSVGAPGSWVDMTIPVPYTANAAESFNDELDNQEIYYRIGFKAAAYSSGTANCTLVHTSGSTVGVVRITSYASATSVGARVLDNLGSTAATADWEEGTWSEYRGYPRVPGLFDSRVWWYGRDKAVGSESDLYEDFDDNTEGDAGPIQRSIGEGPIEDINWVAELSRMVLGTATMSADVDCTLIEGDSPLEARSTIGDEPITPTNFNIRKSSASAAYVDRSETRIFDMAYDVDRNSYQPAELTLLVPDLNAMGIVQLAVQYRPDTRVHALRSDGSVAICVLDRVENVICFTTVVTSGVVEDICILPGTIEDEVHYQVQRTIDGSTVRYHEKWALESECIGEGLNKQADSFIAGPVTGSVSITDVDISPLTFGLAHQVYIDTSGAHGKQVGDLITISGVVASGNYQVNGEREVLEVVSATRLRIYVKNFTGTTNFVNGAYISGGSFAAATNATMTGLDHLEGATVVGWGDGIYLGTYTVLAGAVTFSTAVSEAIVGLPYSADWQSTKLGDAIGAPGIIQGVALDLMNTHATGIRFGQSADRLSDLPQSSLPKIAGVPDTDYVYAELETRVQPISGKWETDNRLRLQANAPKPACVRAAIVHMQKNAA